MFALGTRDPKQGLFGVGGSRHARSFIVKFRSAIVVRFGDQTSSKGGSMTTALEKGDAFRDTVDLVLAAAGFRTNPEARVNFKKVDNIAIWSRDDLAGPVTFLFETKDYKGTLPKSECQEFVAEYGSLVRSRHADHAWLISHGPISPDGKALIENEPGLKCFTFWEFQRRLLLLDTYLRSLIDERSQAQLDKFYIPPETPEGSDLLNVVTT